MKAPLRFTVIGCGSLAQDAHLRHITASSEMTLHSCCDISPTTLATAAERFKPQRIVSDFREAIRDPDVDAVCLATTEALRLPVIALAAECGKPVYVEKPLAPTLAEMYEIQRVVNDSGIPLCVGHNRRSSPAMIDAHRIFRTHMSAPQPCPWRWEREASRPKQADSAAAVMSVRINDDHYSWKNWVYDSRLAPEGPMLFEMTHFTDLCNWFLDAEPEIVCAMETGMYGHGVIVRYAGGNLATLTMGANGTFGYPKELYEMIGGGGVVVVDHMVEVRTAGIAGAPARQTYPLTNDRFPEVGTEGGFSGWFAKHQAAGEQATATGETSLMLTCNPDKGHAQALARFVAEIRGEGPVVCGVDDAVRATRVSFAAIRAAREGRLVELAEI